MLTNEALNISAKATTAQRQLNSLTDTAENGRKQYNLTINVMELEEQAEALHNELTQHTTDNLSVLASIITIHGLKVAARGRLLRDKQGKPLRDENGNPKYTPANVTALRILKNGTHDDSGILEDMQQSVALAIWEAIAEGKATITIEEGKPKLTTTNENDGTLKGIYNVVQNYMYTHQQRHYKRQYIPVIDENTGVESIELVTKAMREYAMSLHAVDMGELFQELTATLNEKETAILWAMCETDTVERAYSDNGKSKKRFVHRKKSVRELVEETGYSKKQVSNSIDKIRKKLQAVCLEQSISIF